MLELVGMILLVGGVILVIIAILMGIITGEW